MKIANASDVILKPRVREEVSKSLASGEDVLFTSSEVDGVPPHSPELSRHILAGRSSIGAVRVGDGALIDLGLAGMGGGTGLIIGGGIGVVLDQLKLVHPSSSWVFDAACAAIGLGTGAAAGTAIGTGQIASFEIEPRVSKDGAAMKVAAKLRKT